MSVPAEDREILYDFINESNTMLDQVEARLKREGEAVSPDTLQACFRLFHSVKGTAGYLRLDYLFEVAKTAEKFLNLLCTDALALQQEIVLFIGELCSFLRDSLQRILSENSDEFLSKSSGPLIDNIYLVAGMEPGGKDDGNMEILEAFVWEADDLLAAAEQEFVLWDYVAGDGERLTGLYRTLQRLRENFSFYGYSDLLQLSEAMESLMERYLNGEVFQGEYPERVFLQVVDAMRDAVASLARSGEAAVEDVEVLLGNLQAVMRMPLGELLVKAGLVGSQTIEEALRVQEDALAQKEEPRRLGEVLVDMGEVTSDQVSQALTEQQQLAAAGFDPVSESEVAEGKEPRVVEDVLARRDIVVDGNRLQQMQELFAQLQSEVNKQQGELPDLIHNLVEELRSVSVSLSKVPARTLIPRMNRLVHDLALQSGKKVTFKVVGEEVEFERDVLESLSNPLVHLLRNGIDHGIEPPEKRGKLGKDPQGRLTLSVLNRQGEIWASVEDDGAGLDLEKIVLRATHHGLIDADQKKPDSRLIASLIFKLGFTTSDKVTDSSGRGIGMDAVKRSLRELGGRVDVFSRPGKGTRVTLRIPV